MTEELNDSATNIYETIGAVQAPSNNFYLIETTLLGKGDTAQDITKPYRVTFKGMLTSDKCSSERKD